MRREILKHAISTVLAIAVLPAIASAAPLNVLFITADDLGVQVGCYGDSAARTPHIDALAARGCLFENAYVAQASCSPSRSAMFTGLYPHTNGQYGLLNANVGFSLHESLRDKTIPALLKQQGYSTGIIGKLHVGNENWFPFDVRERVDTRDVKAVAERAGEFFRTAAGPFFYMANFSDPHRFRMPDKPKARFPHQYKGIPENPLRAGDVPPLAFQRLDVPGQLEHTAQYYNASTRFDAGLGLVVEELAASGHADDTLIIFVGDHGPPFLRGKTSCHEGGTHVPLIVVWPEVVAAKTRSKALVSTVDILPTILDAVGSTASVEMQGQSLRGAVANDDFRRYLATEFHYHGVRPFFPRRAIRDARFKLIHTLRAGQVLPNQSVDADPALTLARETKGIAPDVLAAFERTANPPEFEFYDLEADPWEFRNLAEDSAYADEFSRLQQALLRWRRETADPLLTDEGYARIAEYESRTPNPPRK